MTYVPIPHTRRPRDPRHISAWQRLGRALRRRPEPDPPPPVMRPANAGPPPEPDLPPAPPSSPAHLHRVERYLHLGFTESDAQLMACAKDHDGFFVYWVDVGAMLDAGCTHATAVAIYA